MPAYNFKKRFVPAVLSGAKRQTFRLKRKRPTRAGETLYLYTGMRTKSCRRLRTETCTQIVDTSISSDGIVQWPLAGPERVLLLRPGREEFARADGFESFEEMRHFFAETHELPVSGETIYWNPTPPQTAGQIASRERME